MNNKNRKLLIILKKYIIFFVKYPIYNQQKHQLKIDFQYIVIFFSIKHIFEIDKIILLEIFVNSNIIQNNFQKI